MLLLNKEKKIIKNKNKSNCNNNNKTDLKDIIQCQRVIAV